MNQLASRRVAVIRQLFCAVTVILLVIDEPLDFPRHPGGLVQFEILQHPADQPLLVFRIDDLEALRQAGVLCVSPQEPVCQTVEGANPEVVNRHIQQFLDTPAHFGGGLVGESDGQDAKRRDMLHLDQPRDPVHEHTGLAAAGTGNNKHGLLWCGNRLRCASFSGSRMGVTSMEAEESAA